MSLPAGWVALDLEASSTERLLSVLEDVHPGAAERARMSSPRPARGSMLAVDLGSDRDLPADARPR